MERLTTIDAVAVPLNEANIDSGTIFPSRFLRRPRKGGYQDCLFQDRRFDPTGQPRSDFPLNQPIYRNARILVTGANFGCGSSREPAVFALIDAGFLCIIAPSFGEIFRTNCFSNGLLPVSISHVVVNILSDQLRRNPGAHLRIDLQHQIVTSPEGDVYSFTISPAQKRRLMLGQDDCALAVQSLKQIAEFEQSYFVRNPWVTLKSAPDADHG